MTELALDLGAAPSHDMRDTLERLLYWVVPGVRDVRVTDPARLVVDYAGNADPAEIRAALRAAVDTITAGHGDFHPVVLHDMRRRLDHPALAEPFEELVRLGWVVPEGTGVFTYTGPMADLFYKLDDLLRDRFGEYEPGRVVLPALLSPETLLRTGNLTTSAHAANYVFHLVESPSATARFVTDCVNDDQRSLTMSSSYTTAHTPDAVLSTAVCQPFFRGIRDRILNTPVVVTGQGPCFRYESGATKGLRRLREFTVRELICVGTEQQVTALRQRMLTTAKGILADIGMSARIMTAADSFFIDTAAATRMYQLSFEVKHELVTEIPFDGTDIAIGSVNHHGDHFGRAWGIRTADGEPAHSCCIGLGLDRWCYAIFAQFGLDQAAWPPLVRQDHGDGDAR